MQKIVNENKTIIFKGPYSLAFKEGEFDVLGITPDKDERITIPENKFLPVYAIKQGKLEVQDDYPNNTTEVNGKVIPVSWEKLVEKVLKSEINSILIIGAGSAGKTTLTTYLANKLSAAGRSVSLIDSDLGQSDIGPVGSIGLSILEKKVYDMSASKVFNFHFVGAVSPCLNLVELLVGLNKLRTAALRNSNIMIVDTSGWITGDGARVLKQAKIDLLNPDLIVLLQKNNECEHLIKNLYDYRIFRATVSENAREKLQDERKENRRNALLKYFVNAQTIKLSVKKIKLRNCFYTTGKQLDIPQELSNIVCFAEKYSDDEQTLVVLKKNIDSSKRSQIKKAFGKIKELVLGQEQGVYVGLMNDKNEYIGVGFIEKIDFVRETIYIYTNTDAQLIRSVSFGIMKYDNACNEVGYIEPGLL